MCFEKPQAPNLSSTAGQTLQEQLQYAPQVLQANETYSPQYTALDLQNLSDFFGGTGGTPGFLSEYQNALMPALTNSQVQANTAIRAGTIADATSMAPQLATLAQTANPQGAALLSQLGQRTGQELSYGTELTPSELTQLQQSARGGAAARGMGFGPGDMLNEAFDQTNEGQALLSQREGAAQGLVPTLQGFYGNPLQLLAGIGSTAGANASALTAAGFNGAAPAQGSEFNPEGGLTALNQNLGFESSVAGANNANTWATAPLSTLESY